MIYLGIGYSLIAGWATLSMMILPVIIRTTEESIRAVPNELREASRAMGATKWQTTYRVVFPAAIGGTITGQSFP
ncbi:ABC transporter permease subunit [Candidatus Methanarcanum hacksteinii]|uniref:ABC transporter permease subunit n=1 Tax=Candidatus Methanarcanum hacksteinii TaxID=2911857 RepID=UPI0037DCFB3E